VKYLIIIAVLFCAIASFAGMTLDLGLDIGGYTTAQKPLGTHFLLIDGSHDLYIDGDTNEFEIDGAS
jgi:hypothetical protein